MNNNEMKKFYRSSEMEIEDYFRGDIRHKPGAKPIDYLNHWLKVFRPFAYATRDGSWGELEKILTIIGREYVSMKLKTEKQRTPFK